MPLLKEQKLNILAIELLEAMGNTLPTEAEIQYVENLLHHVQSHFTQDDFPVR